MRKRLSTLVTMAVALVSVTSCGVKETFNMVNNPIHVQGEIDPMFGIPVAEGSVRLDELLGMLGTEGLGLDDYINQDSNTITIRYQIDQIYDSIEAESLTGSSSAAMPKTIGKYIATKDDSDVEYVGGDDTTITYGVDINFFDNIDMEGIEPGNIAIRSLWLDFKAKIKGDCAPQYQNDINNIVKARIDNLRITYIDYYGDTKEFHDPQVDNIVIKIDNLLSGDSLERVGINLAQIIDDMPKHIDVSFDFHFGITTEVFGIDIMNFESVMDSIGLTKLYYWADAKVEMPLDIAIGNLPYSFPVSFGQAGGIDLNSKFDSIMNGLDVDVKELSMYIAYENHMPLTFGMSGRFLDENDNYVGETIFDDKIESAHVTNDGIVDKISKGTVDFELKGEEINWLAQAAKIEINLSLGTAKDDAGILQFAKIKLDDYLKLKMSIKANPNVNIDIPIK